MGRDTSRGDGTSLDLLDVLTHELKTPLAIMSLATGSLRDRFARLSVEQREEYLRVLSGDAHQLSTMLDRLEALNDLQRRKLTLDVHPVDVCEVIAGTIAGLSLLQDMHDIVVQCPEEQCIAVANDSALHQILVLVLNNASRYEKGEPVWLTMSLTEGSVEMSVRDRGVGTATADVDDRFESYRCGGAEGRGPGVGLTLARGLARAQGGTLRHRRPRSGRGSEFVLTLVRQRSRTHSPGWSRSKGIGSAEHVEAEAPADDVHRHVANSPAP